MKTFKLFALMGLAALVMTACENKEPVTPDTPQDEPIPASYPKKHLIEEFTGQDCGYCPGGMKNIHSFIGDESNWVLILHHYGYKKDNFSVKESSTITSALAVNGAPNMAINRTATAYGTYKDLVISPYALPYVDKSQFETETYASVNIQNSYNSSTRELRIKVSGAICKEDYPENLKLTVLVKESGMVDYQSDYNDTWQGWTEFRHTNAVRGFATAAKGDPITVKEDRRYEELFAIDIAEGWVPENCMVVAFLSEDFKPIIQVEEAPVIKDTKGGADIQFGGITAVPTPDYYPEPGSNVGISDFSGHQSETLTDSYAYYDHYPQDGITMWTIYAQNPNSITTINNTNCFPYIELYLYTTYTGQAVIPNGTYPINTTYKAGTVDAGFRNEEQHSIYGSTFYFVYSQQNSLYWMVRWLIADGELVITDEGWTITGHAWNGTPINLVGSTPIQVVGPASNSPRKLQKHEEK